MKALLIWFCDTFDFLQQNHAFLANFYAVILVYLALKGLALFEVSPKAKNRP